jgi:hypothetical protein
MSSFRTTVNAIATLLAAACAETNPEFPAAAESQASSVWTVDFVRTFPGQQDEYVRSIEANWAGARSLADSQGWVLSYRALVAPPDSGRGWDVLLMTEYVDSTAWANREAIFEEIFASPEYVRVVSAIPSSEMRTFALSGLVMREFVSEIR